MARINPRKAFLAPFAIMLVAGCASFNKFFDDVGTPDSPETTGLFVVGVEFTDFLEKFDLFDSLVGLDEHIEFQSLTLKNEFGETEKSYKKEGKFVFDTLTSGRYTMIQVDASYSVDPKMREKVYGCGSDDQDCPKTIEFEYPIPYLSLEDLTFEILPGDIVYLGAFDIWENDKPPFEWRNKEPGGGKKDFHRHEEISYQVTRRENEEIEALSKVLEKEKNTPWGPLIRKRLGELEGT